jgi:hypothetical protein
MQVRSAFITLQNVNSGAATESLTLESTALDTLLPDDGQVARILIKSSDILKIKALTSLATGAADTFISMTNGVVNDLGGIPATVPPFEPIPNKNEPLYAHFSPLHVSIFRRFL